MTVTTEHPALLVILTPNITSILSTYSLIDSGNLTTPIGGTLNVYSKADIDGMFKDLNGLTYVGTVGANGTYTMGTDFTVYNGQTAIAVHNGDMLLVAGDI